MNRINGQFIYAWDKNLKVKWVRRHMLILPNSCMFAFDMFSFRSVLFLRIVRSVCIRFFPYWLRHSLHFFSWIAEQMVLLLSLDVLFAVYDAILIRHCFIAEFFPLIFLWPWFYLSLFGFQHRIRTPAMDTNNNKKESDAISRRKKKC